MGFEEQDMPGQQPDPEFKAWFAGPWKQLTEAVEVPGMRYASWDRKAAYICWRLAHTEFDLDDVAALLRYIETGNVNEITAPDMSGTKTIAGEFARIAASVGNPPGSPVLGWAYGGVNPAEIEACPDYPEGVISGFDSAKW